MWFCSLNGDYYKFINSVYYQKPVSWQLVVVSSASQGSVETYWRCGGIFDNNFIEKLLLGLTVTEFCKLVSICD